MREIAFILNEDNVVFHDEVLKKPCSGTLYSALKLVDKFNNSHKVTVYHKGNADCRDNVNYENIQELNKVDFRDCVSIFVGAAGKLIKSNAMKFSKSYYWLHNYERTNNMLELIKEKKLNGIVCVSAYQMFTMLKSNTFFYSTYIHNPFNFSTKLNVAFSGALKKEKGLHNLIYMWKRLSDKGLDINLHIFGSGNIYGKEPNDIGITEVVDKEYEASFIDCILDENGNIDKKVKFYGLTEKSKMLPVIEKCDYFISGLNEKGAAECFSIAFLEAQSVKTPVLTLNRGGQSESLFIDGSKSFPNVSKLEAHIFDNHKKRQELSIDNIFDEWMDHIYFGNKGVAKKRVKSIASGISVYFDKLR
ncbi:glycosyltransferase [Vibrio parahaemolyticus]|nr:glycosyltransferase [Vibrio parahaemolyticus]EJC6792482.1 glycosyltransferase [Vibrio parahaemolyticus]EJC6849054.1 glycosyltransferase [Vibrio parahaemolyticus]EJC7136374.1 glycosyltransferase [Vibrio parahaemolyticus]EKG9569029.1 glycosyltransferase [Vibrio parahaemolyticus]